LLWCWSSADASPGLSCSSSDLLVLATSVDIRVDAEGGPGTRAGLDRVVLVGYDKRRTGGAVGSVLHDREQVRFGEPARGRSHAEGSGSDRCSPSWSHQRRGERCDRDRMQPGQQHWWSNRTPLTSRTGTRRHVALPDLPPGRKGGLVMTADARPRQAAIDHWTA
jgi:hypothetical protein